MYAFFKQLIQDEAGVTAIEYGLIAALVAIAAIAAMTTLGTSLSSTSATSRSLCKRFVGRRSTALVAPSSAARPDKLLNKTGCAVVSHGPRRRLQAGGVGPRASRARVASATNDYQSIVLLGYQAQIILPHCVSERGYRAKLVHHE